MEQLYTRDLDEFVTKLDEVEAKEQKEINEAAASIKGKSKGPGKKGGVKVETLPSSHGIRIEPRIDAELKEKVSKVEVKDRMMTGLLSRQPRQRLLR